MDEEKKDKRKINLMHNANFFDELIWPKMNRRKSVGIAKSSLREARDKKCRSQLTVPKNIAQNFLIMIPRLRNKNKCKGLR